MIRIGSGDILDADVQALVNTVNTVGVMGKGLALQFRRTFPENHRRYVKASKAGEIQIGCMFVTDEETFLGRRTIINFPTKEHWRAPSRLEWIEAGLADLRRVLLDCQIESVAVPPLGSGLGGLDWRQVRRRIEDALSDLPVDVLLFEPHGAPNAAAMKRADRRPRMTPSRAAIVAAMARYLELGDEASPLVAQKLAYFLQAAGEPMQLRFAAHTYGPYADQVRHILSDLEGHYVSGIGDGTGREPLTLLRGATEEARGALSTAPTTQERLDAVMRLIDGFESPYSLELLATTHWVAAVDGAKDPEAARAMIIEWSARKERIFQPSHVDTAWTRLATEGWLDRSALTSTGRLMDVKPDKTPVQGRPT